MKNVKKLFVVLIALLILPLVVQADMGAPSFTKYSVRVKNTEGTYLVEFNYDDVNKTYKEKKGEFLKYDTIVDNIFLEDKFNGEMYGYVGKDGNNYIKLSDCEIVGKIDYSSMRKEKGKLYVYKEGAYLYKGPSKTYGKVDENIMIPVGTIVEYELSDELFAYVTYNGVSGWVYSYQGGYAHPYKEGSSLATIDSGKLHTIEDTIVYTLPENGEETGTIIPKNTKIKYIYKYNLTGFEYAYYVTYKNISGWVKETVAKVNDNEKILIIKSVNICEKIEQDGCSKALSKIEPYKIIPVDYKYSKYDSWYHVTYNGVSGWVFDETYTGKVIPNFNRNYNLKVDEKIYSNIYGEVTDEILGRGIITVDYYINENDDYDSGVVWLHVLGKNNNSYGWIKVNRDDIEETEEPSKEEKEEPKEKFHLTIIEQITYLVLGTIILAILIIVIIKLINEKKPKKLKKQNDI